MELDGLKSARLLKPESPSQLKIEDGMEGGGRYVGGWYGFKRRRRRR